MEIGFESPDAHEQQHAVQLRAYHLWEQRGQPWGTPEVDWSLAERELQSNNQDVSHEPITVTAAKAVGSALGSVAGLVTSVAKSFASE